MAGMTEPLGVNESSGTVKIGPFLDSSDGKTPLTSLTIVQADVQLSKNNGPLTQKDDSGNAIHDKNGWYDVPLNVTDISDTGKLLIAVELSAALPVWRKFEVEVSSGAIQSIVNYYGGQESDSETE